MRADPEPTDRGYREQFFAYWAYRIESWRKEGPSVTRPQGTIVEDKTGRPIS